MPASVETIPESDTTGRQDAVDVSTRLVGKLPKPIKVKYSNGGKTQVRNSLFGMGRLFVVMACLAAGVDISHSPIGSQRWIFLGMIISTLLSLIPVVGDLILTACFRQLSSEYTSTILLVERLKYMGVPEIHLPKTSAHWQILFKHYDLELQGSSTYASSEDNISFTQHRALVNRIRNFDNMTMGMNLQRYFGLAVKDAGASYCYNICSGFWNTCGFRRWYGGSHEVGHKTVNALRAGNVPYSSLVYALDNWEALWAEHVKKLFQRAFEEFSTPVPDSAV